MPPPGMDPEQLPFWQDTLPRNPYLPHPYAPQTQHTGSLRELVDRTCPAPPDDGDWRLNDDDTTLGGVIVSPHNADRRRDVMAQKISPFDIYRLGNVQYHGGVHGYNPLTEGIIHCCGYTEIISVDVILSYTNIIDVHSKTIESWEHPRGHYKGPQLERILEMGLQSFPRLATVTVGATVEL